jgi:AcrR family transcriptional regulator
MDPLRFADVTEALQKFLGELDSPGSSQRKQLRILEAATELFIRQGYRRTSVDQIARESGVAKGTVYLHFKTKAELLVYAVALEKKRYVEAIRPILDGEMPACEKLRAYLRRAVELIMEMPLTSRLMEGDREVLAVFDELDADVRSMHDAMQIDFMCRLLDPAAAPHRWTDVEVRDRARVVLSMIYTLRLMLDERIRRDLPIDRFAGVLADMLVDGLCPPAASGGGEGS